MAGMQLAQSQKGQIPKPNCLFCTCRRPLADNKRYTGAALSDQENDNELLVRRPMPTFTVLRHSAGLLLGAARKADDEDIYYTTQFLIPNYAYAPNAFPEKPGIVQCRVPIDDHSYGFIATAGIGGRHQGGTCKIQRGFSIHASMKISQFAAFTIII